MMKNTLKKLKQRIKKSRIYPYILLFAVPFDILKTPLSKKRNFIISLAKLTNISVFIVTGTYLGDTVSAVRPFFKEIISIELSKELTQQALNKFKRYKHIKIINRDSSEILPTVLQKIHSSVIFWLDGHYSGNNTAKGNEETPIRKELETIIQWWINGSIILIDDVEDFLKNPNYPDLEELKSLISARKLCLIVLDEIIMIK
jgi:hypothetical protein